MTDEPPACVPLGDQAATLVFGATLSLETHQRILDLAERIRETPSLGVLDVVPAYATLTVWFDPAVTSYDAIGDRILDLESEGPLEAEREEHRDWVVPVRYDGPDLASVADRTGLTIDEVVERHTGRSYRVYMIGFVPGFPFLGDLDPALMLPRRDTPRTHVPPGSVAIAGFQTGIYPLETPGGWHVLGHTEIRPFDLARDPAVLFRPGDVVRFEALR